jgi:hypothetical protein
VELDGVDLTYGVLQLEAEGVDALNVQATSNTADRAAGHGLQVFEASDIARHSDGA